MLVHCHPSPSASWAYSCWKSEMGFYACASWCLYRHGTSCFKSHLRRPSNLVNPLLKRITAEWAPGVGIEPLPQCKHWITSPIYYPWVTATYGTVTSIHILYKNSTAELKPSLSDSQTHRQKHTCTNIFILKQAVQGCNHVFCYQTWNWSKCIWEMSISVFYSHLTLTCDLDLWWRSASNRSFKVIKEFCCAGYWYQIWACG